MKISSDTTVNNPGNLQMSLQGCLVARPVLQGNDRPLIKHFARAVDPLGVRGHVGHGFKDGGSDTGCASEGEHISLVFLICGRNLWNEDQMAGADVD